MSSNSSSNNNNSNNNNKMCAILYIIASLTTVLFATASSAQKIRQSFESLARLAFEHGVMVSEKAPCRDPKPQLIYFTEPSKVYLPRATLLHRCSDLTGCCPHSTQTCQPLETESVDLYFYTIAIKSSGGINSRHVSQYQNIDRIAFTNHTRCGCRSRLGTAVTGSGGTADDTDNNAIFDDLPVSNANDNYRNVSF